MGLMGLMGLMALMALMAFMAFMTLMGLGLRVEGPGFRVYAAQGYSLKLSEGVLGRDLSSAFRNQLTRACRPDYGPCRLKTLP